MASLKDKVKALSVFAWNNLRQATDQALKSDDYKDFEAAFKQVRACERLLQAVRSQVRTHMRKTKLAMQASCPPDHDGIEDAVLVAAAPSLLQAAEYALKYLTGDRACHGCDAVENEKCSHECPAGILRDAIALAKKDPWANKP